MKKHYEARHNSGGRGYGWSVVQVVMCDCECKCPQRTEVIAYPPTNTAAWRQQQIAYAIATAMNAQEETGSSLCSLQEVQERKG